MHAKETIKIFCCGDVVGQPGKDMFAQSITGIKDNYQPDCIMVNGENADKSGRGITQKDAEFLFEHGADVITLGNHAFSRKESYEYLAQAQRVLRPLNFPSGCPGIGITFVPLASADNKLVAFINLQGRVFMREHLNCPFKILESALTFITSKTNLIVVDFHAEATSEKRAMGFYFDGKVSAVLGTHTHTPTADEQILPAGTGYISDLGMCGAACSMLGIKKELVINQFLTQLPAKFAVEDARPYVLSGVILTLDSTSGKCVAIERVHRCA